jgi:gamma-glutamyltranspeptidase/glutathione hydrolase
MKLTLAALLLLAGAIYAQISMFPAVRGTREMVAAANNFEVEAGYRLLQQGGNAVDAGIAAILAATVTEQARIGFGGEVPLMVKMKGQPARVLSGIGTAPAKATVDYYRRRKQERWESNEDFPPIPAVGIHSAILPGIPSAALVALSEHGTKSFAEVAQPAIDYAEGFPIGEEFVSFLRSTGGVMQLWPSSRSFFFPNDKLPVRGEIYRLTDLAKTFRELVAVEKKARGNRAKKLTAVHDYLYKGAFAKRIADFNAANDGLIALEDLAKFKAEWDTPRTTSFGGYEVLKPGFFTQGPVMLQALNILAGYDLKAMKHNSPEYLHTVIEAVKLAFADRDRYYGDPKFSQIPEATLLSMEYAAGRRAQIDAAKASLEHRPGKVNGFPALSLGETTSRSVDQDTTCVNVVDKWGNVFTSTPSGAWLPSVIVPDSGFPLSSRLQSFVLTPDHANQLAPGKRPRVTLSPTMVLKGGEPYLVMSTPGGDNQDQAMLQVLLNLLVFDMQPQEAVEAPRFQTEHFFASFAHHEFQAGKVNLEERIPMITVENLRARGHKIQVTGAWSNGSAPTVIVIKDGVLNGGADLRRGRFIFGR